MPDPVPPFSDSGPRDYNPDASVSDARREAETRLLAIAGVQGVGEGRDALGEPVWIAYIVNRVIAASLPKSIGGRAVLVEVSGEIDAQPL